MPGKSQIADRIAARGCIRAAAAARGGRRARRDHAALAAGERVTLTGFGTFEATGRAARTGRNPRTGEALEVAATTVARFHPGATLRCAGRGGSGEPLGAVADLSSLQGLAAPRAGRRAATPAPAAAAEPKAKPSGDVVGQGEGASAKAKAKAEAKKADVKKRGRRREEGRGQEAGRRQEGGEEEGRRQGQEEVRQGSAPRRSDARPPSREGFAPARRAGAACGQEHARAWETMVR